MRARICDLIKKPLGKKNPQAPAGVGVTINGETFLVEVFRLAHAGSPAVFVDAELSEEGLDTVLATVRYHARRFGLSGDLTPDYRKVVVERPACRVKVGR